MIKKRKNKAFFFNQTLLQCAEISRNRENRNKIRSKTASSPSPPSPPSPERGARVCNQSNSRQYKLRNKELNITTVPWRGWGREGVANTSPVMFARWHSLLHTFRKYWTNVCIAYAPTRINKCLMKIVSSGRFVDEQTWRTGAIIRPCSLYRKRNDTMGLI